MSSTTGDFYKFNRDTRQLAPAGNVGLHHARDAELYGRFNGAFLLKKANAGETLEASEKILLSKKTDAKCCLKKYYV